MTVETPEPPATTRPGTGENRIQIPIPSTADTVRRDDGEVIGHRPVG